MLKKIFIVVFTFTSSLFISFSGAFSQDLFTYGDRAVTQEEFLRVYQKNNAQKKADFSEASVREYLDLYALFRMKVAEAEQMRLDTTEAVINELNSYKSQLALGYLSDKSVTDDLVKEAYNRMKEDIHVSHILIPVKPNEDTVQARKLIDSIYNVVAKGTASFEDMAQKYSQDKGSAVNGGDIGYITALQVVYPFENAAYNTPVGKVSAPFTTLFGYHILKVKDKRPNKGQIVVQHILISAPKDAKEEKLAEANQKLTELQQELKNGVPFEDLVVKYSDDRYTKDKKGLLDAFGAGRMVANFESAAFALKQPGDISEPVKTDYGFHIIKLVEKQPLESFDEIKAKLTQRVENDSRATLAKEAFQEKIKKEHNFREEPSSFSNLADIVIADTATANELDESKYKNLNTLLFELGGKRYTQSDFMDYVMSITRGNLHGANRGTTINDLYKMYQKKILNELQEDLLLKTNADYRNLLNEYRDGILLFDLMEKNVWAKASLDTTGLAEFYLQNKDKYQWQPSFEGTVYQSGSETDITNLSNLIQSGMHADSAYNSLIRDEKTPAKISSQYGRFEMSRFALSPNDFQENKPTRVFKNDDANHTLIYVQKLYPEVAPKTLEEARGFVIADYQDYLEKNWNSELKNKYPLKINEKVFKKIIK